jgi:hypothetical protein
MLLHHLNPLVMEILVFKTDIIDRRQVNMVELQLNKIQGIIRWNVDLHDCDSILRVVSDDNISPRLIEQHMLEAGHYCAELED